MSLYYFWSRLVPFKKKKNKARPTPLIFDGRYYNTYVLLLYNRLRAGSSRAAAVKTRMGHIIPRARQQRGPLPRLLLAVRPSPRNLDHGFTYFPHNPIPCPISDAAEDVNNNNTAPATMVGTAAIDDGRGLRGRPVCVVLSGLTSVSTPTPPPPPPPTSIGRRRVRVRAFA